MVSKSARSNSDAEKRMHWLTLTGIIAFSVLLLTVVIHQFGGDRMVIVTGTVMSHQVDLHEQGHSLSMLVKIPDVEHPVKVAIPNHFEVKIDAQVNLVQNKPLGSDSKTYTFFDYLD